MKTRRKEETLIIITIILLIFNRSDSLSLKSLPEDGKLNFTKLSEKYGHTVDEHEVITEDGYVLTIFRLGGRRKPPIFLLHGLADTADCFIIRGRTSLAISLAEAGYDVWAGNVRGNRYSRKHLKLNPDKDREFWDFTFHEIGFYDLPAMIDHILKATREKSLQTIGHSQGTTAQFVLLSKRPEYNEKIKIFIAMAPVTFLTYSIEPITTISKLGPIISDVLKAKSVEETFSENSPVTYLLRLMCSQDFLSYEMCFLWTGFYITGFDTKRLGPDFTKVVVGHYPDHTSTKNLRHLNQLQLNKRFCEYDYGPKENVQRYGYKVPPDYNLRKVKTKVALILGENDPLARISDTEILRTLLPNVVSYHIMEYKNWTHVDFTWGNDMNVTLFPLLFRLLEKYD